MFKVGTVFNRLSEFNISWLGMHEKRQCRPLSTMTYLFTTYKLDITSQKPPNLLFMRPQRESFRQS